MAEPEKVIACNGMNILSIVWYKVLPARFGGQKGIALFNQYLSEHSALTCICSNNNEPGEDLPSYDLLPVLPTGKWQFFQPSSWKKIRQITKKIKASHIIAEHPYYGIAAVSARKSSGARLIVHSHNIESERFRQLGKWWWRLLFYYEKWTHKQADLSLFKTEDDLQWAIRHFGLDKGKCMLLPYGIEIPRTGNRRQARMLLQQQYGIKESEKILLFAATLDYEPNALAVKQIFQKIAPALAASGFPFRIIICGRNRKSAFKYLESFTHSRVIMAGEVRDIDLFFVAADAFINPVLGGGGIQTKNMDALSYHCNIVCFDNMIDQQLLTLATEKIFISRISDWEDFNRQIINASNTRADTPAAFFETYSWTNLITRFVARLKTI